MERIQCLLLKGRSVVIGIIYLYLSKFAYLTMKREDLCEKLRKLPELQMQEMDDPVGRMPLPGCFTLSIGSAAWRDR
ncbi:MAG: hypothetical protein ACLT76_03090 [Clostridium fessum]